MGFVRISVSLTLTFHIFELKILSSTRGVFSLSLDFLILVPVTLPRTTREQVFQVLEMVLEAWLQCTRALSMLFVLKEGWCGSLFLPLEKDFFLPPIIQNLQFIVLKVRYFENFFRWLKHP